MILSMHRERVFASMGALFCSVGGAFAQDVAAVGAIEQSVLTSKPGQGPEAGFQPARLKQGLAVDQHVRTLKRSRALLKFADGAELRVNERTELVMLKSADMRRIKLGAGGLWIKVPKGTKLVVETPVVTAAVRGTEFEIDSEGNVRVYDGTVEVAKNNEQASAVIVEPGFGVRFQNGKIVGPGRIPDSEIPTGHGGSLTRWYEGIVEGRENRTASRAFRSVEDSRLPYAFRPPESETAANPADKAPYRPRFDVETDGLGLPYAVGAAGSLLTYNKARPSAGLGGRLMLGKARPSFALAELTYRGRVGDGIIDGLAESRAFVHRGANGREDFAIERWESHLASELMFRFNLGCGATLFTGRGPLFDSPVFLDPLSQSVVRDRFTTAGVNIERGPWGGNLAWTYDEDPWTPGRQSAWMGSISHYALGAKWTLTGTKRSDANGSKVGFGGTIPLIPSKLDLYGEISSVEKESGTRSTLGFYLPEFFESADIDLFVEFQSRKRAGSGWAVYAEKGLSRCWSLVMHAEWARSRSVWGAGISLKF